MKFTPDMSMEEFVKLAEQYANERYGTSVTAENSSQLLYTEDSLIAEAEERKNRMLAKQASLENTGWDLTSATMDTIKLQVHRAGNLKVGKFQIRIKNYCKTTSDTMVDMDIFEEKIHSNSYGSSNKIPNKIDVNNDVRFNECSWSNYFKKGLPGESGKKIPIDTAIQIIRWCQGVHRMGAFI